MAVPSDWRRFIEAAGGAYRPLSLFNDEPLVDVFTIEGVDYTGAAFEGKIRAAFELSSPALKSFSFDANLVGSDTVVEVSLSESDIQALRSSSDPGAINTLFYSIKCTPDGGTKQTWLAGEFQVMGA